MGWKGLLPKAYPQNVWMCKSPVCGIEAMRSSAERVEPLQKPGQAPGGTLDSRVRRAHLLITLPTVWRRIHLIHLHKYCCILQSSGVSCDAYMAKLEGMRGHVPASILGAWREVPLKAVCLCLF